MMDTKSKQPDAPLTFKQMIEQVKQEYEQIGREMKEVDLLVQQSSGEAERLAHRNTQIATRLHHMEANIETLPRHDIKEIYTTAQESQMRLFMMRGQIEQLQNKQQVLERYAATLRQVLAASGQAPVKDVSGEVREGLEETSSIVRVINAQEIERQRLARQMHDGPAQSLTNLILQAEICERLFDQDPERARAELSNLKESVDRTFRKVRHFIFELRPMMLDDLGLTPTLRRYVQDFRAKSGLAAELTVVGKDQRLPPHAEVTIFRVIQALLNNIREHANASRADVYLKIDPDGLYVSVEDDGSGFDLDEVMANAHQRRTLGIITMIEQAEMLGGEIHFDSSPGQGTKAVLRLPI